tara:strand:+ start:129 stop:911 length:783 start_codon:yes stop_codon:yes gene_type:complete
MLLLFFSIVIPSIIFPLIKINHNTRYHFPYANLPIAIFNKTVNEKPHRENLKKLLSQKDYIGFSKYFISNDILSRIIYNVILNNKSYRRFNNLTVRNDPFTLFTNHHLFGLYGIRFNIWEENRLIDSPQLFTKQLYSDQMTNAIFASRYWQAIMYPLAEIVNRHNQTGIIDNGSINTVQIILNHYLKWIDRDVEKVSIEVSPIYDRESNEEIIWRTFCNVSVLNKKINGKITFQKLDIHPFNSIGVKELQETFEYGLKYD